MSEETKDFICDFCRCLVCLVLVGIALFALGWIWATVPNSLAIMALATFGVVLALAAASFSR